MRVCRVLTVAGFALLSAATSAISQTPEQLRAQGISPAFAQYLQSKSNRDVINQVIKAQIGRLPGACTDITIDPQFKVVVFAPVEFDGRKFAGGAWKEFVPGDGVRQATDPQCPHSRSSRRCAYAEPYVARLDYSKSPAPAGRGGERVYQPRCARGERVSALAILHR